MKQQTENGRGLSERERAVYRRAMSLGITVKREKGQYRYFNYTNEIYGRTESLDHVERLLDHVANKRKTEKGY
jgi:hypothetical protein